MDWIDWKIWEENAVREKRREGTRSPAGGRFTGLIRCRHQPNVLGSTALRAHLPSHAKSYDHEHGSVSRADSTVHEGFHQQEKPACIWSHSDEVLQLISSSRRHSYHFYSSQYPSSPDDRQIRLSIPPDIRLFVTLPANAHLPPENEFPEW